MKKLLFIIGLSTMFVFTFPLHTKAITSTPTDYANSITGRLRVKISGTKTTGIQVTADTYKTASGTSAITFPTGEMILRLSRRAGNFTQFECIAVESGTTQSSATVTLGTVTRNISCDDGSQFTSNGAGLTFPGGTIVEMTWSVHHAENTAFKDNANKFSASGAVQFTGSGSFELPRIATDAQRDQQFSTPREGQEFYHTGDSARYTFSGGIWALTASGGVVNAGFDNAGKVEFGTPAEIFNQTASGSSNAGLTIAVKDVITGSGSATSTGATSNVVATSGSYLIGTLLGPNAQSGNILQIQSNGTARWRLPLDVIPGFNHEATVTTASSNVGASSTATGMVIPVWTGTGVDANSLKVGSYINVSLGGNFTQAAGDLIFILKVDDTEIHHWRRTTTAGDESEWYMDAKIYIRAIGASGTAILNGSLVSGNASAAEAIAGGKNVLNEPPFGTITVDTTNALHVTLHVRFATSNAGNFVNIQTGSISYVNP